MKPESGIIVLIGCSEDDHKELITEILMKQHLKHEDVIIIKTKEELASYKNNIKNIPIKPTTVPIQPLPVLQEPSYIYEERKSQQNIRNQNKWRAKHFKK
jgi:hypothetical protein